DPGATARALVRRAVGRVVAGGAPLLGQLRPRLAWAGVRRPRGLAPGGLHRAPARVARVAARPRGRPARRRARHRRRGLAAAAVGARRGTGSVVARAPGGGEPDDAQLPAAAGGSLGLRGGVAADAALLRGGRRLRSPRATC